MRTVERTEGEQKENRKRTIKNQYLGDFKEKRKKNGDRENREQRTIEVEVA